MKNSPTLTIGWNSPTFNESESYARFVLDYKRLPAWKQFAYEKWMKQFRLFCTYNRKRYRCTGASWLGDVWLTEDFNQGSGYELRVNVEDCSEWSGEL